MERHYPSMQWRHCPYCGGTDIGWVNGTHEMRCVACARRFFINAAAAVIALIRDERGQLLFTRRRNEPAAGKLDFPGGFVDLGEKAEDAVRREIREELGLELSETKFLMSMPNRYLFGGIVYFTLDMVFECKCPDLSGISAADDVSGFVFAHPSKIDPEETGLESVRTIVAHLTATGDSVSD